MNVLNIVPMADPTPPPPPPLPHQSVMPAEVMAHLAPEPGGVYVDATLGAGGHTDLLLQQDGTKVVGIDRDKSALAYARFRLQPYGDRFIPVHAAFSNISEALAEQGIDAVDGILADVGLSSLQLDDPDRGMSFRREGPLDMRMDPECGETALDLIARLRDDDLADVIYKYGEERRSRRVARCIKQALAAGELETTKDLRRAVIRAVGPARIGGVDPATRTFQALRIAVNGELDELEALLRDGWECLRPGGKMAIISFHSLEDRIVKRTFRDRKRWDVMTKKPLVAGEAEVNDNPRSRSAKLRVARKIESGPVLGLVGVDVP